MIIRRPRVTHTRVGTWHCQVPGEPWCGVGDSPGEAYAAWLRERLQAMATMARRAIQQAKQ